MNDDLPPDDLPLDATHFWQSPALPERPPPRDLPSALERLGPSPFPKSRFPFLGFLATVYDEVASRLADPSPSPHHEHRHDASEHHPGRSPADHPPLLP